MNPKGILLVISAPSGAGKSTLIRMLCRDYPGFGFSVSYTTRKPRENEVHGKDYFFVQKDEFQGLIAKNFFAEWAEVHGNFYGTPARQVLESIQEGRSLIMDVDIQGARQIKNNLQQGAYIFIFPPSLDDLRQRLMHRGSDTAGAVEKRLQNAAGEMLKSDFFDYWLVNDDLDSSYARLKAIVLAEMQRPFIRPDLARKIASGVHYDS
ncbi:guanylate kinase [Desulfonatronospira thiodismutans ASO3-1]|uniref:Guanylate kinase n=1 Tax=Desulfonatronospira thiodismutans ASO3-1 TaxID=555779 RepID=D6SMW2_9BACT|nr:MULTISPECIES: guanylate kinase [Desulfonatronospira]EFI36023.1 guanylate kinase [Desulfonatronospira thiodismutans ASO3-1]RQD73774.1 MAG: guanylate kinase [Desulfonatronospira sp. MSAO_Bac3]